ncbi:PbrT family lead (Pb2+) uptake porter [Brachybacterium vulturis]|uniref:PbrT family lead (Pb2+) uptake porter n=1 Tax=Brachybacterium vulturis TaxID=2017484 RepID=A0A291GMH4_9MICO|nr:iron uptake system protein EfeO [Brachybacterium vulturis]ATG51398.1 PbrT family lead (Pb2+) uptake porter [Brachybacterium vulturis]
MTRTTLMHTVTRPLAIAAVIALAAAGCTDNPTSGANGAGTQAGAGPVGVTITDEGCAVASTQTPSGAVTFSITNEGTVPNEFEILASDKLRIVTEKENIGPGTTVELTTGLEKGDYFTACKPNMVGALVGVTPFTVTQGEALAVDEDIQKLRDEAITDYTAYIEDQAGQLLAATEDFRDAYLAGDTERAQDLYVLARRHFERIEPTAEAFGIEEPGDLDAALDLRIQDLSAGAGTAVTDPELLARWTGWHRIEADLFSDDEAFRFPDAASRQRVADQLVEDTQTLYDLVTGAQDTASGPFEVTLEDVTLGAGALMEEVATGKIVGEEETFSHTDLDDFQANLDGARVAYGNVQKIVETEDPDLAREITDSFAAVQEELSTHQAGEWEDGTPRYVDYSTIAAVQEDAGPAPKDSEYTDAQRSLSLAVTALADELAQVPAVVLS